jgi:hypothetical protein
MAASLSKLAAKDYYKHRRFGTLFPKSGNLTNLDDVVFDLTSL